MLYIFAKKNTTLRFCCFAYSSSMAYRKLYRKERSCLGWELVLHIEKVENFSLLYNAEDIYYKDLKSTLEQSRNNPI